MKRDKDWEPLIQNDFPTQSSLYPNTASESFSALLNHVGDFGKWQWLLVAKVGLCGAFTPFHNLGAVFLAATPNHWCQIPSLDVEKDVAYSLQNMTTPWVVGKTGELEKSKCEYYEADYSDIKTLNDVKRPIAPRGENLLIKKCSKWFYDSEEYGTTVVSEWDLVCDQKWLMSATQATYMVGILLGAVIFSAISDRFGRRRASLIAMVMFFISSMFTTFSSSLGTFLFLRMITAGSGQGMYLINFVMTMECSGLRARTWLPNIFTLYFGCSSMFLPLIAYYYKNWRLEQLATSIPAFILFSYFWILPESPRWLCMNGRIDEGLKLLKEIAQVNGSSLPPKSQLNIYVNVIRKETEREHSLLKTDGNSFFKNVKILFRTPNMRIRTLTVCYCWFVASMVTYGLLFNSVNINLSKYKSIFLMNIVNFPTNFILIWLLERYGRRLCLSYLMILGGISCLAVLFIPYDPAWINLILTATGRNMIGMAFGVLFIYSSELVPTNVRNTSMGVSSMSGRIGSIISPFVVDFMGDIYFAFPSVFFGGVALLAGILAIKLPETGFEPLPESVEEVESKPR